MKPLSLHSEPFSPDGNLSAEGFENLLGTPSLDLLQVLVREAVQNSCDATRPDAEKVSVRIRIRALSETQRQILKNVVFRHIPDEQNASTWLQNILEGESAVRVLEIADYGTTGLGGPTRADQISAGSDSLDFVNFFRNAGAARKVEGSGGTYGYGKATLYRASRAHTIVVDTSTTDGDRPVRRFMAAQMGRAIPGKFTGRHWWGVRTGDGRTVDPVIGPEAHCLAERLGMPDRAEGPDGFGTTIMIVAPYLPPDPDTTLKALVERLLWNFWPRMMATTDRGKRLEAWVASEQEPWTRVPEPECFPPLNLLCRAIDRLRGSQSDDSGDVKLHLIRSLRPKRELGRLAIAAGTRQRRRWLLPPPDAVSAAGSDEEGKITSIIPDRLHHVALMRPVQLVVRYEIGPEAPDPDHEWGGVFMCAEDADIERAFAKSEPPAHDDWRPEALPPRSRERSFVNVALRRVREYVAGLYGATAPVPAGAEGALGRASAALGRRLPGAQGSGAGIGPGKSFRAGRRRSFAQPRPRALRLDEKWGPVAEFVFEVQPEGRNRRVEGIPRVVIDGALEQPDDVTGIPEILEWIAPDGSSSKGTDVVLHVEGSWLVRASVPGEVAVALELREQAEDIP